MSYPHHPAPETRTATVSPRIAAPTKPIKLSQSSSLLLDILRFSAALVVLKCHVSGEQRWAVPAHAAVCVFFVLSGFIIRFITVTRINSPLDYSIDRISRIYSVALPAIIFTILCVLIGSSIHPSVFAHLSGFEGWGKTATHSIMNLTWVAQCWGYNIFPPDNGPFWSLSYECIYYAAYALTFYRTRHFGLWLTLLLLLAGPTIALLYPIWLLGAWTCDLYLRLRNNRHAVLLSGAALVLMLAVIVVARHPILAFLRWSDVVHRSAWLTHLVEKYIFFAHYLLNQENSIPWLIQSSPSYYIVGPVTAAVILFGMLALDRYHPSLPPAVTRYTRLVADSTFALYLFHAPAAMLVAVLLGYDIHSTRAANVLLIALPLAAIPLAVALDRLKVWMRDRLYQRFAPRPARA